MELTERKETVRRNIMDEIIRAISKTAYGEVTITIHDSRIVQVEKKEKKRF